MTNRPTDDFDELADDQAGLNNPDEEQAAFGEQSPPADLTEAPEEDYLSDDYVAKGIGEGAPQGTNQDDWSTNRQTNQADDSAFVEDDMADIAGELAEEENTAAYNTEEGEYDDGTYEEEADPLADDNYGDETAYADEDGVQYEIIEGEDEAEATPRNRNGNDDGKRYFGKYKKNDLIFYGGIGAGGLIAVIIAIVTVLGGDEPAPRRAAPVQQTAQTEEQAAPQETGSINSMVVPNTGDIPSAQDLPATAEPSPAGIGVAGALTTLQDEPAPAAQAPAADLPGIPDAPAPAATAQAPIAPTDSLAPLQEVAPQPQAAAPIVPESIPAAPVPIEPIAPIAQNAPATVVQDEPLAPVAQVTAPPQLGVDNTALSERMSELSVKVAELNAQLVQVSDTLSNLQKTTEKLDKQNQDLTGKAGELTARVEDQNKKLEEANKEREELAKQTKQAAASNNVGSLDEVKISLAQLERRVATIAKGAGQVTAAASAPAPKSFDGPPQPKPTPIERKPRTEETAPTETVAIPQPTNTAGAPRSPKARDQAGMLYTAPKPQWVLRGATPTMAWLSPRAGSAELRRVAPGDAVDGIGQIIEIRQESGRWTVIGTEGVVR